MESTTAWYAGDGIGEGNLKGIGIEICYSLSGGERFLNKIEDRMGGLSMTQYEELEGLLQGIDRRLAAMEGKWIWTCFRGTKKASLV